MPQLATGLALSFVIIRLCPNVAFGKDGMLLSAEYLSLLLRLLRHCLLNEPQIVRFLHLFTGIHRENVFSRTEVIHTRQALVKSVAFAE